MNISGTSVRQAIVSIGASFNRLELKHESGILAYLNRCNQRGV